MEVLDNYTIIQFTYILIVPISPHYSVYCCDPLHNEYIEMENSLKYRLLPHCVCNLSVTENINIKTYK